MLFSRVFVMVLIATSASAGENLLKNPGFENGLENWHIATSDADLTAVTLENRNVARIQLKPEGKIEFPRLFQEFDVSPGDRLGARAEGLARSVTGGHGVYSSIEYVGSDGKRLSFIQSDRVGEEGIWVPLRLRGIVPLGAVKARYSLILNGYGQAYFENSWLTRSKPVSTSGPVDSVTLTVTGEIACNSLIGFGAEDDGWFYNEENAAHGVTEEDAVIREGRIEWMDPDWVRTFFWHLDWCPSGDWEHFDFDTPNMRSHFRTLDLYQRIGARVNVTGVDWGMKEPYSHPEQVAHGIGALMEHLIRERGYDCIRDWTLTNEPNHAFINLGHTFEDYVRVYPVVKEEFARRGLAINLVGSDDAQSLHWFERCVESEPYAESVDLFASHRYFPSTDRIFVPDFFRDRLEVLRANGSNKPFLVGEFGFQDSRSGTLVNPLMEAYPYALWTSEFVIDGLNQGVAGFSIWCLHEVYYPGNGFMNYGLWDFKDNDWKPRPVYHAWSQFSRLTEAGETSFRCTSSHPEQIKAAVVGDTLFWVNPSETEAEVRIRGMEIKKARIHTEENLSGDRESGVVVPVEDNRFFAPPESFGYAISNR